MNNTIKWSIGLLAVVVVTIAVLRNGGENGAAQAASIETARLDTGDIIRSVATSGAVRPLITVEVGSQLSGQIEDIYVDFNSEVSAGQVIALIDAKTFESRVVQNRDRPCECQLAQGPAGIRTRRAAGASRHVVHFRV